MSILSSAILPAACSSLSALMSSQWSTLFLMRAWVAIGAADAAVVGVDFKVRPVVRLHEIGHGKADGMLAQVGGDIADAQLAARPAVPHRMGVAALRSWACPIASLAYR